MGREVRRVPADWEHPKDGLYRDGSTRYKPLFDGSFTERLAEYLEEKAKWERGEFPSYADAESKLLSFEEWSSDAPREEDYMPDWPEPKRTHLMMYETCSEGTPISPAFLTPEELARWLVDNNASAFGGDTASYKGWLRVARGGYACSAVISPALGWESGVDAMRGDEP
jgi:hypothetical protein